jgi:FKBP-type peptidyl-prolyl cis-trans isomerase
LTADYTDDTDGGKPYHRLAVKSPVPPVLSLALAAVLLAPAVQAQREKLPPADLEYVEKTWPEAKRTVTGIRYLIVRPGTGEKPKPGDKVNVLYVGRLLNGTVFDQATEADKPFTFRVRRDMVIEGWDQIIQLMQKGEKRLVIIPPELAYGTRGQPPKIGRNATLVFEMELLSFGKD